MLPFDPKLHAFVKKVNMCYFYFGYCRGAGATGVGSGEGVRGGVVGVRGPGRHAGPT